MTALLLLTSPRGTLSAVGGGSAAGPFQSRHVASRSLTVADLSLDKEMLFFLPFANGKAWGAL